MTISTLYRFYRVYLTTCRAKWLGWLSARQRIALLQQATQWQIEEMSEEEYRHWI